MTVMFAWYYFRKIAFIVRLIIFKWQISFKGRNIFKIYEILFWNLLMSSIKAIIDYRDQQYFILYTEQII